MDIATAADKLGQIIEELNEGIRKNTLISDGLVGCVDDSILEVRDKVLMRVCFTGDSSMNTVVDFKKWGSKSAPNMPWHSSST